MTDKEKFEALLKKINKEFPDRKKLGRRLGEVYQILAMDELELLTLDQYRGQNMDYVLQQLQIEGLALGDTLRELDEEIAKKYNVRYTNLQYDLAQLYEFDVENMRDLPSFMKTGMSAEPLNKSPEAKIVDNVFNEIVANFDNSDENVVDFRQKQLEKLMKEVEDATPDVKKITSSQAEMIDNALADAAANLRRGTFEALPGGKGALTKAIKTKLFNILGDGLNVLDVYELGLLLGAVGQPALDPIVKIIFPDAPDDNRPYKERVLENIQRVEKISPTAKAVKKISEAMPEPDDTEYTIYGVPSNRAVQFTSMYGMLGGNNGEK